ncbi:hypothetical protein FRC03_005434 [Tulasnella sp. 419]|nr:hypothetical protein FRC02_003894 [Tulasnella sp. 418]KAG8961381.1 hypothetical protein FRC03_005434 [Tulasnella sp. 419]
MSESKLFTTITIENIREALAPYRKTGAFYIITAESGYCPACHSDLSSANITAPNSLLGHLRRSKKCITKREDRGVKLFGLKQPDSLLWGSVDDLAALDSRRYPDRELWIQNVFPPTRPQASTPMYNSVSQWNARTREEEMSAPSPSGSSDDGSAWCGSSSSSSHGSPTSAHFHQQYVLPNDAYLPAAQYDARRESNATITGDYYKKHRYSPSSGYEHQEQQWMPAPTVNPGSLSMGLGSQYRAPYAQQPLFPPQQSYPVYPNGYPMQPSAQPPYQQW